MRADSTGLTSFLTSGADDRVSFRILGTLAIENRAGAVLLRQHRVRCAFGVLLMHVDHVVSIDDLVDLLWEQPPPTARTMTAGIVGVLRRNLRHCDQIDVQTVGRGYQAVADPMTVDWHLFRRRCDEARRQTDQPSVRAGLAQALTLWRGPALADASTPRIRQRLCVTLDAERLAAQRDAQEDRSALLALD